MPAPNNLKRTASSLACGTWRALARKSRKLPVLNGKLAELGYQPVSRTSLYRWLKEENPRTLRPIPKEVVVVAETAPPQPAHAGPAIDFSGIPPDLIEAVGGYRMLIVAKGRGLDLVEDAIVRLATVIASRAEEQDVDGRKIDADSLMTCAEALHRVMAARTLPAIAHRTYSESDKLSGEGDKYRAEAEVTRNAGRADNAKQINGTATTHSEPYDTEAVDDALAALREVEKRT